ncbi:hypothetical protein J6590_018620 [Homalodisca vitripennis]|nr:hypothetical protein J6590_018620 [Homalodisca vitripennis]
MYMLAGLVIASPEPLYLDYDSDIIPATLEPCWRVIVPTSWIPQQAHVPSERIPSQLNFLVYNSERYDVAHHCCLCGRCRKLIRARWCPVLQQQLQQKQVEEPSNYNDEDDEEESEGAKADLFIENPADVRARAEQRRQEMRGRGSGRSRAAFSHKNVVGMYHCVEFLN